MTVRKSTTGFDAEGNPVKTIELTAEDITKSEPEEPQADTVADQDQIPPSEEQTATDGFGDEEKHTEAMDATQTEGEVNDTDRSEETEQEKAEEAVSEAGSSSDDYESGLSEAPQEDQADRETESGEPTSPEKALPASGMQADTIAVSDTPRQKGGFFPGLVGGLLGGAAILALAYGGLQQGYVQLPSSDVQSSEQATQIAQLQSELSSIKSELVEVSGPDIGSLVNRLSELESKVDNLGTELIEQPTDGPQVEADATQDAGAEEAAGLPLAGTSLALQFEGLTARIDELKGRLDTVETLRTDLIATNAKVAALELGLVEQAKDIETKAAEQTAKLNEALKASKNDILSSSDRRFNDVVVDLTKLDEKVTTEAKALRERVTSLEENNLSEEMQNSARTIALASLENAVASGSSFQMALNTFSEVVGEHEAVASLAPYADGAPTSKQLVDGYRAIYDDILRQAEDAGATTMLDKFLLSAQSLVKVRSLSGEKKGESLTSRLGVIDYFVGKGDLTKAAEEWDGLPDAAKESEAAKQWINGLKARIAVDAAMDTIRAEFGKGASNSAS
ncbi:hypothetical protein [uncultured Cohaesibacter sp.]|uniref:hypothetical protein n=1 Tax=uncultured Cohaesibacter sp. TaxID=1002546 RepID=UPI0029300EF4|nr:hypothetical protein [uncultured Cohaesibacter sp.]